MDELEKGLEICIVGDLRDQALGAFGTQIADWGVALPEVAPLVLDFGLGDFYRTGLIEYWIANEMEEGYCGKYLFVFECQTCPEHRHNVKHETFFIVKGRVQMCLDGSIREMGAGDTLPVAPGKFHSFTGIGPALLLELSTPCEIADNYFRDTRIPIGGNSRS
ncbi:MAG: D-lyxose/D-mannose family sugar isomerase [Candidatus Latescibacterota bacterium]